MAAPATVSEPSMRRDIEWEAEHFPIALADLQERLSDLEEHVFLSSDASRIVRSVWHDPKLQVSEIGAESARVLRDLGTHDAVVKYVSNAADTHFGGAPAMPWAEFIATRLDPRQVEPPAPEVDVFAELEHLEFWKRVAELREAGRISLVAESKLQDMAQDSTDLREFKTRLNYGGPHLMDAVEHRYVSSAVETPEGRRPETWAESSAYVRAFGTDGYTAPSAQQRQQQDQQQMEAARAVS
ncbi:hypothetical protein [Leucobacter chromiiresistens]|nr:hypothetical protein [Leucobacter chromiiresistens]